MMASDQLGYMEQESPDNEQNQNMIKIEESDRGVEDSSKDDQTKDAFYMPEHFLSTHNTAMPLAVEQNPNIIKTEKSDQELEDSMDDADKEAFFMPEHFLSQTLTNRDSNEGMDVNYVVGASAETLYTLTHTYETGRKRVKYSCNVCEKDFEDKRVCIRHVRGHTGEKPFMCLQCGKRFGREDYLRRHIKSHTGEKPFSCPICNKKVAHKATLDQHLLTHTDMSERPFPCNQCESGFVKRSHLERHLKTHAQTREFVCTTCGKGFNEKRHLIDHEKRRHSDRVLPSCEICNREFRWEHLLKRHMKAHTHNSSIDESEELLLQSLPIFVSKDKQKIQANTQNPSTETSDSHSLLGNVLSVNDGPGVINNDTVSQNSDTVKASILSNSTNEELSSLNPQFFQSSVNDIGKTCTQINRQEMVYNSNEFNNLGGILEKPTADSGMIPKEQLAMYNNVLRSTDQSFGQLFPSWSQVPPNQ